MLGLAPINLQQLHRNIENSFSLKNGEYSIVTDGSLITSEQMYINELVRPGGDLVTICIEKIRQRASSEKLC